jgi:hypothetical protein
MDEQEWLACTDPEKMLEYLEGKAGPRKLRLFACACCRRLPVFADTSELCERGGRALTLSEGFADAEADRGDLYAAHQAVLKGSGGDGASAIVWASGWQSDFKASTAQEVTSRAAEAAAAAGGALVPVPGGIPWPGPEGTPAPWPEEIPLHQMSEEQQGISKQYFAQLRRAREAARREECRKQCDLLRCVFGNPFRPIPPDAPWLAAAREQFGTLALSFYRSAPCPDLWGFWKALEETGCRDVDIRKHCWESHCAPQFMNSPGLGLPPHPRGCWVLDLVLGKE